ncbi:hypothetical protein FKM82_010044 [Ascaphus truei]
MMFPNVASPLVCWICRRLREFAICDKMLFCSSIKMFDSLWCEDIRRRVLDCLRSATLTAEKCLSCVCRSSCWVGTMLCGSCVL